MAGFIEKALAPTSTMPGVVEDEEEPSWARGSAKQQPGVELQAELANRLGRIEDKLDRLMARAVGTPWLPQAAVRPPDSRARAAPQEDAPLISVSQAVSLVSRSQSRSTSKHSTRGNNAPSFAYTDVPSPQHLRSPDRSPTRSHSRQSGLRTAALGEASHELGRSTSASSTYTVWSLSKAAREEEQEQAQEEEAGTLSVPTRSLAIVREHSNQSSLKVPSKDTPAGFSVSELAHRVSLRASKRRATKDGVRKELPGIVRPEDPMFRPSMTGESTEVVSFEHNPGDSRIAGVTHLPPPLAFKSDGHAGRGAGPEALPEQEGRSSHRHVGPVKPKISTRSARSDMSASIRRMSSWNLLSADVATKYMSEKNHQFASVAEFLDDPYSSAGAFIFNKVLQYLVLLTALTAAMQNLDSYIWLQDDLAYAIMETTFDVLFISEVIVRFVSSPNRWLWVCVVHNWIDILAGMPLFFRISRGFEPPSPVDKSTISIILRCIVPIIRLLKLLRHFEAFRLLLTAFMISFEALPMLLYTMTLLNLSFSTLIYVAEPRDNIESWQHAIWFSIVTMTTVGYGDVSPTTQAGYAITSALIISSLLFMAIPIGIIGSTFQNVWESRDKTLLIARTHMALLKWGYTIHDIPALFRSIDSTGKGALNVDQFTELLKEMRIGLSEERIVQLFDYLDGDGSAQLDYKEFARVIFRRDYLEVFGHAGSTASPTPRLSQLSDSHM